MKNPLYFLQINCSTYGFDSPRHVFGFACIEEHEGRKLIRWQDATGNYYPTEVKNQIDPTSELIVFVSEKAVAVMKKRKSIEIISTFSPTCNQINFSLGSTEKLDVNSSRSLSELIATNLEAAITGQELVSNNVLSASVQNQPQYFVHVIQRREGKAFVNTELNIGEYKQTHLDRNEKIIQSFQVSQENVDTVKTIFALSETVAKKAVYEMMCIGAAINKKYPGLCHDKIR